MVGTFSICLQAICKQKTLATLAEYVINAVIYVPRCNFSQPLYSTLNDLGEERLVCLMLHFAGTAPSNPVVKDSHVSKGHLLYPWGNKKGGWFAFMMGMGRGDSLSPSGTFSATVDKLTQHL